MKIRQYKILCPSCAGKGCKACNFSGVQDVIETETSPDKIKPIIPNRFPINPYKPDPVRNPKKIIYMHEKNKELTCL